jgi:uncharacterized membrane protein
MSPAAIAPSRPRLAALDAARALGIVAMVAGHTLDALLSPAARALPGVDAYWKARGFTAPLFLLVAGWALTVATRRARARGSDVILGRLPRIMTLLAIGVLLRWPGWGREALWRGDLATWEHLLAFDALHAIAAALLLAALVFSLGRPRREEAMLFALLLVGAVALGMHDPSPRPGSMAGLVPWLALGGSSPFPVVPWVAYVFAGCLVGMAAEARPEAAPRWMAFTGGTIVAATFLSGVGSMLPGHPVLILYRIGVVLLTLAVLSAVPGAVAGRLAPVGRLSLAAYAIHVPVIYGWSTTQGLAGRVGPVLSVGAALGVAALVLGASLALAGGVEAARTGMVALLRRVARAVGEARGEVEPLG